MPGEESTERTQRDKLPKYICINDDCRVYWFYGKPTQQNCPACHVGGKDATIQT